MISPRRILIGLLSLAPLWLCALLGGYFCYQARFDQEFRYYEYPWRAHWISSPYKGISTACFRKVIEIAGPVQSAYIVLSADDFYTLKINGNAPAPFFHPSDKRTWAKDQAIYTGLGYPRRDEQARIYDLRPFLRMGRNVFSVMVQSDQGTPRLAVQGAINAGVRQVFTGDETWKVAPQEQRDESVSWTSPYYLDTQWAHALITPERVNVPANGDYTVLDTPMQGSFIGANAGGLSSEVRLRNTLRLPDRVRQGWLRVSTLANYDLFLNDRYIGGTATQARYDGTGLLTKHGDFDAVQRTEFRPVAHAYPRARLVSHLDVYPLKNVLQQGENHLEIRLRPRELPELTRLPACCLDGRLELADGTTRMLQTDASWQAADSATGFKWSRARVTAEAGSRFMDKATAGVRDKVDAGSGRGWRLLRNDSLFALGMGLAGLLFVRVTDGNRSEAKQARLRRVGVLFLPAALVLITAYVMQELFRSSEQDPFFSSGIFAWLVLAVGVIALLLAVIAHLGDGRRENAPVEEETAPPRRMPNRLIRYGCPCAIAAIMLAAFTIYRHGIANESFLADEYVSMLAAHGILKRGIPIYLNTGIVYTRSSLFHYLLALFMAVGGEKNVHAVRLVANLWGVATIPLVYCFGREVQGRVTGLAAAALLAFSPFWVYYAREVRFYTQFGFFTTLTFYLLLLSVRNPLAARYRVGAILAFCGGYLSQQFIIAVVPPAFLVLALAGSWRQWLRRDTWTWLVFALGVMLFDFAAYLKWCQTPLAYVDAESVLLLSIHTDFLDVLPAMLLSNFERSQAAIGLLYLGGLFALFVRLFRAAPPDTLPPNPLNSVASAATPDEASQTGTFPVPGSGVWNSGNYLYFTSALTIVINALISARPATRYIVHVAPLVALTAAYVAVHLGRSLIRWVYDSGKAVLSARLSQVAYVACIVLVCAAPSRPLRVWHATERQTNRDMTAAARFIAQHQQPGDKVMFTSPEIAMIELGRCDYMWRPRLGSIFKYVDAEGRLAERNSHALVVDNVDKLRRIMKQCRRIWLVVPAQSLNGESQGLDGELNRYVNANFQVVDEPFGVQALLWDQDRHRYRNSAREYGFDQFNF